MHADELLRFDPERLEARLTAWGRLVLLLGLRVARLTGRTPDWDRLRARAIRSVRLRLR